MKLRIGFVSNSSTQSFICFGVRVPRAELEALAAATFKPEEFWSLYTGAPRDPAALGNDALQKLFRQHYLGKDAADLPDFPVEVVFPEEDVGEGDLPSKEWWAGCCLRDENGIVVLDAAACVETARRVLADLGRPPEDPVPLHEEAWRDG